MVIDTLMKAFLTACGGGLLTLIIIAIKWFVKKIGADNLTMKAVIHDSYFRQARYLLAKDEITEEEYENHDYLYQAYHVQGLNGTGDRLHDEIERKPVIVNGDINANKLP